jgi:hypothetical protein
VAEAAEASRANLTRSPALGSWDVLARPRTWQLTTGKRRQALVTQRPRWWSTPIRLPTARGRHRPVWGSANPGGWRHRGDVTVGLSTCRRHAGPPQTTSLVTHRPESVPARQLVAVSLRRGGVEGVLHALQGGVGVGPPQVPNWVARVERSGALALMASRLLRKLRAQAIPANRPWRACRLPRAVAWAVAQAHGERSARQRAGTWLRMGKVA